MSEAAAKKHYTPVKCLHPFVWPNGDCVECGVLATTLPGHTEPTHISLPRKFTPLIDKYEARINELQGTLRSIAGALRETELPNTLKVPVVIKLCYERAESVLEAGGKQ